MPRKGKCFSTCRKRPKPECSPPECHYTNGNKYRYCRLAFTRKMNADCEPVLRNLPKNKKKTAKIHLEELSLDLDSRSSTKADSRSSTKADSRSSTKAMELNPSKDAIAKFREKYLKRAATRKIGRFLQKTDPRVRSKFLQSVCSDAGVCIAFGKEAATIRKHFNDFSNFGLLSTDAKTIGAVSSNGFVKELTYERGGYVANAILKSSVVTKADNLLYEALVGFVLNKYCRRMPSFVETYGLYQYNADGLTYAECKKTSTPAAILNAGLERTATTASDITDTKIREACAKSVSMSVLIQHLKGAKTIRDKCAESVFRVYELLYVLFQVYASLSTLAQQFTHYDLHHENVLVYEPVKGRHIEYHYHIGRDEIVFNSPYIAKIIDYGRSYFKDAAGYDSADFYKRLCAVCKPECGSTAGFGWLKCSEKTIKGRSQICSNKNNQSHDLRLLATVGSITKRTLPTYLDKLIKRVVYGIGVAPGRELFGTIQNLKPGHTEINNVHDAFRELKTLVQDDGNTAINLSRYTPSNKLGELHIYEDGQEMRYIPA